MSTLQKRNNALDVNDFTNTVHAGIHITTHGSDWYYTVTAIMGVATLIFLGLAFTKPRSQRLFHYITAAITLVATVACFSIGSNLGWTAIAVEWLRPDPVVAGIVRQIFYVRYIDWFVTTPLLLLDLLLTCGLPTPTIVYTILIDEDMVVTGLVSALVKSRYKWGYYSFGCAAFFFVAYTVVFEGRAHARAVGKDIEKTFTLCGVWTMFLWFLYPISWALCEGGNVTSPDSETVFYGILDVCAKPLFGALLLWGHRNIDLTRLGLHINESTEQMQGSEKHALNAQQNNNNTYPAHNDSATSDNV